MATTPDEWLKVLAKRLDDRAPRIALLRSYTNGCAPLPEMGENVRASWEAFQKKARTNYGGRAVQSLAGRLRPNGLRLGNSETNPALLTARRIYRDNRLDVQVSQAIVDYLTTRYGYLAVGRSAEGESIVTREAPEQFIAATDPVRPWRTRAALKVWRDVDAGADFAQVWVTGMWVRYTRPSKDQYDILRVGARGEDWSPVDVGAFEGNPPIIAWERDEGLIEPHLDVIDRINLGKLNRLVTTAMQAFRQRALKTEVNSPGMSAQDEDGNDIDYAKMFEPAPGALWDLPEGIDVWESQQTDIRPLLEGEKSDLRDFAASTGTPIAEFIPDGQNQSATGAANVTTPQYLQAKDEQKALGPGLEVALVYALRAEGVELPEGETLEVLWVEPDRVSMSEKYAAAAQAKAAGLSRREIQRDILGMTPDQIAQSELDLAAEQLAAFTLTGGASGGEQQSGVGGVSGGGDSGSVEGQGVR